MIGISAIQCKSSQRIIKKVIMRSIWWPRSKQYYDTESMVAPLWSSYYVLLLRIHILALPQNRNYITWTMRVKKNEYVCTVYMHVNATWMYHTHIHFATYICTTCITHNTFTYTHNFCCKAALACFGGCELDFLSGCEPMLFLNSFLITFV